MSRIKIKDLVTQELSTFLEQNGYELYNVEFVKEAKDWFLRIYIDRAELTDCLGISTDDCEKVSRYLSERLDAIDPIEQNYYLEVSSPGMDRALLHEKDYIKYAGKLVDVILYKGIDGKKTLSGELVGLINGNIVLLDEKKNKIEIPIEKAAKTKLTVVF